MRRKRHISRRQFMGKLAASAAVTIVPVHVSGRNAEEADKYVNPPYRDGWAL
jgi:hypothetical protein